MTYMVIVEDKPPQTQYEFYQDARDAAMHLSVRPENRTSKIYVVEIKATMLPVFSHRLVEE